MREFLNSVLITVNLATLTDDEFASLTIESYGWDQATYEALIAILVSRESVSDSKDRVKYVFLAKGASISDVSTGRSTITVGGVLV